MGPGDSITMAPEVFQSTYGITVPYKINKKAHVGLASITDKMADLMGLAPGASGEKAHVGLASVTDKMADLMGLASGGRGFSVFSCCIAPPMDSIQEIHTTEVLQK